MSRSPGATRAPAVLAALLLLATAASGCFGGDAKDEDIDPVKGPGTTPTTTPDPNKTIDQIDPDKAVEKNVSVPQAHEHHHWGNPPQREAFLFKGAVTLHNDECRPENFGRPPCYELPSGARIGSVTFTPEDDGDGDDVETNSEKGINPQNKADAVLAGTGKVTVTITWTDENVGDLLFYYRSAKNPMFAPEGGIPIESGSTYTIPVTKGMADIAHQVAVSKWAFRLVANGGPQEDWSAPAKISSGEVQVEIIIHNGGTTSIDPPHPNPWVTPVLPLGKTSGSLQVFAAGQTVYDDGASGIPIPAPSIVPPGTAKIRVLAWLNATDSNQKAIMDQIGWGLAYHGADAVDYAAAPAPTDGDGGAKVFEIPLTAIQWDSPYERQSFFEFKVHPKAGQDAGAGHFGYLDLDYAFIFAVERDPLYVFN